MFQQFEILDGQKYKKEKVVRNELQKFKTAMLNKTPLKQEKTNQLKYCF